MWHYPACSVSVPWCGSVGVRVTPRILPSKPRNQFTSPVIQSESRASAVCGIYFQKKTHSRVSSLPALISQHSELFFHHHLI